MARSFRQCAASTAAIVQAEWMPSTPPDPGGATTPLAMPLPEWLAISLVVGASAAVLVLEILAARLLAPYVGVSLETYTGIIGTVLGGIAVGAWLGGAAADRLDPRRLLPVLLVTGGALAVATIPIVRALGPAAGSTGAIGILVVTAAGFLPSAAVLSAIPPAVVKLQLRDLHTTGTTVGQLSAFGTIGAIAATFLTGFVLVAIAAVTTLIAGVGVVLVLAGLALWWSMPSTRRAMTAEMTSMSLLAGVALLGAVALGSPCDTQTEYYCVTIRADDDRPSGRTLVLDDLRHSYVDLDDPTHLEFWYVRRIVDAIEELGTSGPIDIVHVGGGAMTVPAYVQSTRPGSEQIVLEIDEELVDVVTAEFARATGPGTGIEVVVGDGRLSLRDLPDDSADVVVGDAFGSRSVPWHLATTEFVEEVDRVLRPGGIYVANVIDGPQQRFLSSYAATIATRFEHVGVVLGESAALGGNGNSVIVASHVPFEVGALERRRAAAGDAGRFVDDIDDFIDEGLVLTDDFGPVDQLLAGTR